MGKKLIGIAVMAIMLFIIFGLTACESKTHRKEVISLVTKLNEAREIKFIVESNIEYSDTIQTSMQKRDAGEQLVYMHNKFVSRETGEVTAETLYQNNKDFNLQNKTYYEVILTQNSSISSIIPHIGLLGLESTTFEKKSNNEYFVTIYPQNLINGDMFGDRVLEYTIMIENNFISEIHFAGSKVTISQNIGQQITIDESEFTKRS